MGVKDRVGQWKAKRIAGKKLGAMFNSPQPNPNKNSRNAGLEGMPKARRKAD